MQWFHTRLSDRQSGSLGFTVYLLEGRHSNAPLRGPSPLQEPAHSSLCHRFQQTKKSYKNNTHHRQIGVEGLGAPLGTKSYMDMSDQLQLATIRNLAANLGHKPSILTVKIPIPLPCCRVQALGMWALHGFVRGGWGIFCMEETSVLIWHIERSARVFPNTKKGNVAVSVAVDDAIAATAVGAAAAPAEARSPH